MWLGPGKCSAPHARGVGGDPKRPGSLRPHSPPRAERHLEGGRRGGGGGGVVGGGGMVGGWCGVVGWWGGGEVGWWRGGVVGRRVGVVFFGGFFNDAETSWVVFGWILFAG